MKKEYPVNQNLEINQSWIIL